MQFASKEDIEAPIAGVFGALSDFETFERAAIRRGIEVQRLGDPAAPEQGLAWDTSFNFHGKERALRLTVADYEPVTRLCVGGAGSGLDGQLEIELLALAPRRTRMAVRLSVKPKTLSARLLVQSLKLARGKLDQKFKQRVAGFAKTTEERLTQAV
ncbi:SRPBCC family protein [Roseobacteraceae bacterium NS-SX3]